ncbi:MAG: hypothetical protein EOM92_15060 [Gammaproteobacteria bacterium]|jgi:tetratricopeptide (TPR) repeat protein|nr:hypothetical protein [Gammaproteobacteria bacterium]
MLNLRAPQSRFHRPRDGTSVDQHYRETALHYCVDDLPGATIPSSRLQNILASLQSGKPVTRLSLAYLQQRNLSALQRFAQGGLTYDAFRDLALVERSQRVETARVVRQALEAEQCAREAAMQEKLKLACEQAEAARRARERDPAYIAKVKNQKLRAQYGVDTFIEQHCFGRFMKILKSVDAGRRLQDEDVVWLSTTAEEYFSEELRAAYHRLEAEFFSSEFARTSDPWMAVNASSHYRKCYEARKAKALLDAIDIDQQKSKKLKAALWTTRGGVMRDLSRWEEALSLGERAHAVRQDDYRPCTLLGAIHMETGHYSLGQEWYAKAIERGATIKSVDQDVRKIFFQADSAKQAEMRAFLLGEDPQRYAWAKTRVKPA